MPKVQTARLVRARVSRFESLERRALLTAGPRVSNVLVSSSEWSGAFLSHLESANLGQGGYAIPGGSSEQLKSLPWIHLDRISIQFDQPVSLDRNSLTVTGVNRLQTRTDGFSYDAESRLATWTLAEPLTGDRFLLDLISHGVNPVRNTSGQQLDGDWANGWSVFRSGNGQQGTDFEFRMNVLPGNATQASTVSSGSYDAVAGALGRSAGDAGYSAFYDLDGSGTIDAADTAIVSGHLGTALPFGVPAGLSNNAPTAAATQAVTVEAGADSVFSLWDAFEDLETVDADLEFQVVSVSNPELVTGASIDPINGTLSLSIAPGGAGQATVDVEVTDGGGLVTSTTFEVEGEVGDADPPRIDGFTGDGSDHPVWVFTGRVVDENPGGQTVVFGGLLSGQTTTTNADGTFSITVMVTNIGTVSAQATNSEGVSSPPVYFVIASIVVDPQPDPRITFATRNGTEPLAPTAGGPRTDESSALLVTARIRQDADALAARHVPRMVRRGLAPLTVCALLEGDESLD